jgi:hypothetical protein
MVESLLDAFREEAELVTPVPPFDRIEAAGRARRRRRHAVAGLVAACVLGLAGLVAVTDDGSGSPRPADDPGPSSLATPWPGPTMTTLPRGTYRLPVSVGPGSPAVEFTLPAGWNAWLGPNRFEGLGARPTHDSAANERILSREPRWYAGLLLLEVDWITQRGCTAADMTDSDITAFARALTHVPGLEVVDGPTATLQSGRATVHLRLRDLGTRPACSGGSLFQAPQGAIGFGDAGTVFDARVIDVDGRPFLAWAEWTRHTPRSEVAALLGIARSITLDE